MGDVVYDPFCGSGTFLIACENLQRKGRAMELKPAWAAVILQRYQDATGLKPVLLNSVQVPEKMIAAGNEPIQGDAPPDADQNGPATGDEPPPDPS